MIEKVNDPKSKYCLGIESTAHTFGVGILDFTGNVLSTVNDSYIPETGGLHPRKVVEHHVNVFMDVINKDYFKRRKKMIALQSKYYKIIKKEFNTGAATRFLQIDRFVDATIRASLFSEMPLVKEK